MHTSNRPSHDIVRATPSALRVLPFVGREDELGLVADFFRSTTSTDRLALLWLQGEAGIGKSRFLEHVQSEISTKDNFVLYLRFYPDSATSLVRTFGAAIEAHPKLGRLLTGYTFNTALGLQAALRRVSRMRPTLLIIDDIHLLNEDSSAELSGLLAGLKDEPIAVLCSSRPGATSVYEVVYPYKSKTLELTPLRFEDVRRLLNLCYSAEQEPADGTLRKVFEATHGIPLVLRAALANCLAGSNSLMLSELAPLSRTGFHTKAQLAIEALVACLTNRLTREEVHGAAALASLGEVFSVGTAVGLLGGESEIVDALIEKGILTSPLTPPQPLTGDPDRADDRSLIFVHSLLYEHLASDTATDWNRLLETIEALPVLYSITPLLRIADAPEEFSERSLRVLIEIVEELAGSLNRALATPVFNASVAQYQAHVDTMDADIALDLRLHLLRLRLNVTSYIPANTDFENSLEEFIDLTEEPETERMALHRIAALEYSTHIRTRWWELVLNDALDEAELLLERWPALKTSRRYIRLLGTVASALRAQPAPSILERVKRGLDRMLAGDDEHVRREAVQWIAAPLLTIFTTPAELQDRKKLANEVTRTLGENPNSGNYFTIWPLYLEAIGNVLQAREVLDDRAIRPLKGYNIAEEISLRTLGLTVDNALGVDLSVIGREAKAILHEYKAVDAGASDESGFKLIRSSIIANILLISTLRRAYSWGWDLAVSLSDGSDDEVKKYLRFELAAVTGDERELRRQYDANVIPGEYRSLVTCVIEPAGKSFEDRALEETRRLLSQPIFRRSDILRLQITIGLIRAATSAGRLMRRSLKIEMRNAVKRAMEWSAEHHLPGYLRPLLDYADDLLGNDDLEVWTERLKSIEKTVRASLSLDDDASEDRRPKLGMVGVIQIQQPNGDSRRISGSRVRHVLGLLTAGEMNLNSMSLEDFRRHATGMESSQEAANYLRIMISRLRRLLGEQAILTEHDSAPHLNLDHLYVDLIDAHQLIGKSLTAARENEVGTAYKSVVQALRIIDDNVILPALFDDIFEDVRREFEIRLRLAVMTTLKLLRVPEDNEQAVVLLELAERSIPQDEEIAELLLTTLKGLGRHVEAYSLESKTQDMFDK